MWSLVAYGGEVFAPLEGVRWGGLCNACFVALSFAPHKSKGLIHKNI